MSPGVRQLVAMAAALPVLLGSAMMPPDATAARKHEKHEACGAERSEVKHRGAHAEVSFEAVKRDRSVRPGHKFQAERVSDLLVIVDWSGVRPGQEQHLEVFAPDGSVYQRTATALSQNGRTETRLPVAGTWITQYSLYGEWCVQVYLDRGAAPIARKTFVLTAQH